MRNLRISSELHLLPEVKGTKSNLKLTQHVGIFLSIGVFQDVIKLVKREEMTDVIFLLIAGELICSFKVA